MSAIHLGESNADIPVGFGAFVNLKPTRMSAIHLGESNADIPVGFGAFVNLKPTQDDFYPRKSA